MASTLKKMLNRKKHHQNTHESTVSQLPPIRYKSKKERHSSKFYQMLNASKKRINHRERVKLMASQQIRSKNQFDAFSATLVESNELIHPRKFMRRLNWDHTSSSIKDTEHETYSINCEEQEQRRHALLTAASKDSAVEITREATQPFVSLVPERRKNAALANAIHYLCEDRSRNKRQPPRNVCCHESLLLLLGRESNVCFGCSHRKPIGQTLCWPCYELFLETHEESMMHFLAFTAGTRVGPSNCGKHREADNAAVLIENADDYLRLRPRIGLETSIASTVVAQSCTTLTAHQIIEAASKQLGKRIPNSILFLDLLSKHSSTILLLPSDRYVARTQTLPKAWLIAIRISIVAKHFKIKCPSIIKRDRLYKKSIARLKMRKAGAAFNKWRHMVQEVLDNRKIVGGALKRFLMREVTKAFNQWHEYAHKQKQAKTLARKILARQLGALKVIYFEIWAEAAEGAAVEKQRKIEKMILKWRMMPAALAWRAWVDVVIMMKKARKFGRRILMLAAARSMNAWLELVHANKRVRGFLRRQMLRMQNRRVARLFDAWLLHTDMALDIKEEKIRQILLRINKRWERQFFINIETQYYQQISARKLQSFARRIEALMVLKSLKKQARKKEKKRIRKRNIYIDECVDLAFQAAKKTFSNSSALRKLMRNVKVTQQQEHETKEVNTLLSQETAQNALDLFTSLHIEESIQNIPLEGITPAYMQSLNDVIRTRTEEEHQIQREIIWEEWSIESQLEHTRWYLKIKKTTRLLNRDFLDERKIMFEAAWRNVDPASQLKFVNAKQTIYILGRMNLRCHRGIEVIQELIEDKGVFAPKKDTSPVKKLKAKKKKNIDEIKTLLPRNVLETWTIKNMDKDTCLGIHELRGFTNTEKCMQYLSIATGAKAKKEAWFSIRAVVKEETEQFGAWYFDELCPSTCCFCCNLCSSNFTMWNQWMKHIQTCTGQDDQHERNRHRSIPFRCAYELIQDFPNVIKAAIQGHVPEASEMIQQETVITDTHLKEIGTNETNESKETKKNSSDSDVEIKSKAEIKAKAAEIKAAILGTKQETDEELHKKDRLFQETIAAAWENGLDEAVDHEFDNWLESREQNRIERINARELRRNCRTVRRNKRKQRVMNARWQQKKDVKQKRLDQLNDTTRVFVPGSGVDSRFGTTQNT